MILLTVLSNLLSHALRYANQHYLKAIRPLCVFSLGIKETSGQSNTKYAFNKFRNSYTFRLKEIIIISLHSKERKNLIIDKIFYIFTFTFES